MKSLKIETRTEARYLPGPRGSTLIYYKRTTLDGRYWAMCDQHRVWTHSPTHAPGVGTICRETEVAKRAVDHYMDEMVPQMMEKERAEEMRVPAVPLPEAAQAPDIHALHD